MALEISDIVRVTASVRPRGVLRRGLGNLLFLTTDDSVLSAGGAGKVRSYSRFSAVADDFDAGTQPYIAAQIWFSQSPFPRNFAVGRWANVAANSTITGGAPSALAMLQAVSDGSFRFNGVDVTAVDFSGATSYADVAAALQTAFRAADAAFAAATVTYSASPSRFEIDMGSFAMFSGVFEPHSAGTGTDISSLLGLDAASGATYRQGSDQEDAADALDAIAELAEFYFVVVERAFNGTQTMRDVSAWAGAGEYMFSAESNEAGALVANEAVTELAQMSALQSPRTWATWSRTADYKAASIAARFSSVEFEAPNSLITGKFKTLIGTTPDTITLTEKQELDRKRVNHYSPFGTDNIYAEGQTLSNGGWIDVQYWLDWIVNAIRVDVYNLLRSSPRVPQTPAGMSTIKEVIERVCQRGVVNGGIAPRQVSPGMALDIRQATRVLDFDGFLSAGYLVYVTPIAEQSQADREAREAPPFRVWLAGSGAVHFADVDLTFEN